MSQLPQLNPLLQRFVAQVEQTLLPDLLLESITPHDPVVVRQLPPDWQLLGTGNYAAVLAHPDYPAWVVKIYAPGRPGLPAEQEVYRRLGSHPGFSECFYAAETFLVLKRLRGITLYDCLHRGVKIPPRVIQEVDAALAHARSQGLHPHDVHGRNVMICEGCGVVADVSDFLEVETCTAWDDLKRAYRWVYRPILSRLPLRVPYVVLDGVRASYRFFRRLTRRL